MSATNELQKAVFDLLVADAGVHAIAADRIYDRVPEGATFPYVTIDALVAAEDDEECIDGLSYTVQVSGWSRYQGGKKEVNGLADAIRAALHKADASVTTNALCFLRVVLVRVMADPDGLTQHAVVQVEARMETA